MYYAYWNLSFLAVEGKNAALYVLDQQGAMPFEYLIKEMAKTFGYSRTGENVYTIMKLGIELGAQLSLIDDSNIEKITLR